MCLINVTICHICGDEFKRGIIIRCEEAKAQVKKKMNPGVEPVSINCEEPRVEKTSARCTKLECIQKNKEFKEEHAEAAKAAKAKTGQPRKKKDTAYPFGLMPDHIIHRSGYGPNTFGYGLQSLANQPLPLNPFGTADSTQCISGGRDEGSSGHPYGHPANKDDEEEGQEGLRPIRGYPGNEGVGQGSSAYQAGGKYYDPMDGGC